MRSVLVVFVLVIGSGFAGWLGPSATGFTFMKLGVGARPVAMGQAFTAVADDANALFYNPGGVALNSRFDLSITACQMLRGVSYFSGGLTVPILKIFGAGLAGGFLSATDTRRNELGQDLGTFGLTDIIAGPGFAVKPFKGLGIGGAGKFVYSRIDSFSSWALSFDGGVLYQPIKYLTLGASLLHLGTPRRFIEDWEYPPVNLRGGASFKLPILTNHLLIASDVSVFPDYGPTVGVGAEAKLDLGTIGSKKGEVLYLRGGYQSGAHLGTWAGFSFGLGYERAISPNLILAIDAVYLSYGLLGDAERVSLGLKFAPFGSGAK
ncbi:MAG: PorV/PorQ family protein [candidate division WOR-3 bacterium]